MALIEATSDTRPADVPRIVRATVELELDLSLSPEQLAGRACAVCAFPTLPADDELEQIEHRLERVGFAVERNDRGVVEVFHLDAHPLCKSQLRARLCQEHELWPW